MKKALFLLAVLSFLSGPSGADNTVFQAGPARNTLVQLFTSDASVHCNPALEWMTRQTTDPQLWKSFVPVVMHVNAWDVDGFKDTMARPEFNRLLDGYRASWKVASVYAPTVAANGVEWSGWSRGQEPPSSRDESTGVLLVRVTGEEPGHFSVSFKPAAGYEKGLYELHSCLLAFGQRSKPADGRNRGKSLQHDFLARQYNAQEFRTVRESLAAVVELSLPKNARGQKFGVAFWVTKKGGSVPLQATGGFLPS